MEKNPIESLPYNKSESVYDLTSEFEANFESVKLVPNQIHELTTENSPMMSNCLNLKEGISQNLRSIIKIGDDFFGLVDVNIHDSSNEDKSATILTHHTPNGRAAFVDVLNPNIQVSVGRNYQDNLGATVSRKHFDIIKANDGTIGIVDNDSTNGTEIFTQPTDKKPREFGTLVENFDFWSVKSADVKKQLETWMI